MHFSRYVISCSCYLFRNKKVFSSKNGVKVIIIERQLCIYRKYVGEERSMEEENPGKKLRRTEANMITWSNLDTIPAYRELQKTTPVNLAEAMTGEKGADRVKKYSVPMAAGIA